MRDVLYLCDPDKNTKCRKTACFLNASCEIRQENRCRLTWKPECAKLDANGEKIVHSVKKKRSNGNAEFYQLCDVGND